MEREEVKRVRELEALEKARLAEEKRQTIIERDKMIQEQKRQEADRKDAITAQKAYEREISEKEHLKRREEERERAAIEF